MLDEIGLSKIYRKSVIIENKIYSLAITPEMYNDQCAKNNKCFRGSLSSENEENVNFEMELQHPGILIQDELYGLKYTTNRLNLEAAMQCRNWIFYPPNLNPEIEEELVKMTFKFSELDNFSFGRNFL